MWILKQYHLAFAWLIIFIYLFADFNAYGSLNYEIRKDLYLNNPIMPSIIGFTFILYLLLPLIYLKWIEPKINDTGILLICNTLNPLVAIAAGDIKSLKSMERLGIDCTNPNFSMVFCCIVGRNFAFFFALVHNYKI